MVEAAGARDERLLGGEPLKRLDPLDNLLGVLHPLVLYVDSADGKLLVFQDRFVGVSEVVLYHSRVAVYVGDQVGRVLAKVEVAVPDLISLVELVAYRVVALAEMDSLVHAGALKSLVYGLDGCLDLVAIGGK